MSDLHNTVISVRPCHESTHRCNTWLEGNLPWLHYSDDVQCAVFWRRTVAKE